MNDLLILILLLFSKHFLVDFPLQTKFQYSNKGTYGHPGGILHASLHGLGTFICIYWYAPVAAIYLALADMFVHYHIDWAKMKLNSKLGWSPTTHEQFWWLLGLDQYLHAVTYVAFVALIT
jgi:hypothetical protein